MNTLDLAILVLAILAAVGGYRRGFVVRVFGWGGSLVGMAMGLLLLPTVLDAMRQAAPQSRLLAGLGIFVVMAGAGSALGDLAGRQVRSLAEPDSPILTADHALGAGAGLLSIAVSVWLLAPAAAEVPSLARQVRTSAVVGLVTDLAPRPPDAVNALRNVIGGTRFPEVFDDLRPAPETGPPPESFAMTQETLARVTASTVNVESFGCGARFEGSGWVVEDNVVVTNAHVVAGAEDLQVRRPDGAVRTAAVIAFDDDRDLALLLVDDLQEAPLPLVDAVVGTDGAVVGYPGGQDTPRQTPARVEDDVDVTGRDIYGRDRTTRRVLFTAAQLRQGDSGSPLVDVDGQVVGTIFAVAPDDPDLAYALHADEIRALLAEPRGEGAQGPCA